MTTWNRWEDQPDEMANADVMDNASWPDPWNGDHDIEYWVWREDRLIPATPEQVESIKEDERTRRARNRLERMQPRERHVARSVKRRFSVVRAWGHAYLPVIVQPLQRLRGHQ